VVFELGIKIHLVLPFEFSVCTDGFEIYIVHLFIEKKRKKERRKIPTHFTNLLREFLKSNKPLHKRDWVAASLV
jgi:hypothetical protein